MTSPTLSGSAEWARLTPGQQAAIGAAAIELVLCWAGLDAEPEHPATERTRIYEQAEAHLHDRLLEAVVEPIDAFAAEPLPLPSDWADMGADPDKTPDKLTDKPTDKPTDPERCPISGGAAAASHPHDLPYIGSGRIMKAWP
jgi:hypothetical protein